MVDQTGIEPVKLALDWLKAHSLVIAAWGGADHISGMVEAPWPRLRVTAGPGGSLRQGIWARDQEVRLEGFSAPDGTPGEAEMSRLILVAMGALLELADQSVSSSSPVVCMVRPVGAVAKESQGVGGVAGQQLTSGQVLYAASAMLTGRPPLP